MRLIDDSPNCMQLVHDDVHVLVWRGPLEAATLDRSRTIGQELARANPAGVWSLNVIRAGTTIPDLMLQKKAAEVEKSIAASLLGTAIVLPGEGFWVSAARSFLIGMAMISGVGKKREIVASVEGGVQWIAARSGRDVAWAARFMRELERAGALEVATS